MLNRSKAESESRKGVRSVANGGSTCAAIPECQEVPGNLFRRKETACVYFFIQAVKYIIIVRPVTEVQRS